MTAYRATLICVAAVVVFVAAPLSTGSSNPAAIPAAMVTGVALGMVAAVLIRSLRHRTH